MHNRISGILPIIQAVLTAALFGMSAPFSKLLLYKISPLFLSALLYLGAGIGMLIIDVAQRFSGVKRKEARLTKGELPYIFLMLVLDIIAPVSMLVGLRMTNAASASLLNNFEIVATSVIALIVFKEPIGKRLWLSISLITISCFILSVNDLDSLSFSLGSIFVLAACLCWGLENNCTRKLSIKDPLQVVIIKGFGSGTGALLIALMANEVLWNTYYIPLSLVLGFFAYGLSIFFYVTAQRSLGAARTSTFYAVAPFIGAAISIGILNEPLTVYYTAALLIMLTGTYFAITEGHEHQHFHEAIEHEHRHNHSDGHHNHSHDFIVVGEHSHPHIHEEIIHSHSHRPDLHHFHIHQD